MAAYWIARAKVDDPVAYKRYTDAVPGILKKYNARPLARGGRFQIMEGSEKYKRFVVIEFPSLESAVEAYNSAEYQAARENRRNGGGEVEIVIVEDGDATP
jgi:uncharacterized protein (DUF1330 family)